ncbi:dephospho-CoA kinase [Pseudoalteromonas spongiae]|uniref:Dephospho-CoA kinase n=1 Tax=Pseudoalteromonas spongiae TaxID=298657 RepID=A0ABU8ET71_9GAMM
MPAPVIGLTGGIATGKSTASNYFKKLGITIVDADTIARQVVAPNSFGLEKIKAHFGSQIVLDNGELNRAELRKLIFSNESEKLWLNNLLHPVIRQEILEQLNAANGPYVILDAPLLFENNLDKLCEKTLLVDIPEELQIMRGSERDGVNKQQIKQIIAAQMPRSIKLKKADYVIDNALSLDNTYAQVMAIHQKLSNK